MKAGIVGQIKGPFLRGRNVFSDLWNQQSTSAELMKIGVSIDEKDLMPFGNVSQYPTGFSFTIMNGSNPVLVQMGRTGMYESDNPILINSLSFNSDAPESVIINFVVY